MDIQQLRAETRGTAERIHFNNAGASLPPDPVVETVLEYLREEAKYGGYETEYRYRESLDRVYTSIARLINADKDEVALVENASVAWGLAFNGIAFRKGEEVITSEMEYVTNLLGFLRAKEIHGIDLRVIPQDDSGHFSLGALEAAVTPKTRLIAITHIPSTTGARLPVAEIGSIARRRGILYLVDACQSAGHVPLDVEEIGCDLLAATGRKYLRGPRGTGFLYVRKSVQDLLDPVLLDGASVRSVDAGGYRLREDARRFELFERNRAMTLGLGKAVEYALALGLDKIAARIDYLAGTLRRELLGLDHVVVHDQGEPPCGIVTFSVRGLDVPAVKDLLGARRINVSVGKAASTFFYMTKHHLEEVVRASVHYFNTEEEIAEMVEVLKGLHR